MKPISQGQILIAEPFLKDPNFLRTAILLCEHNDEGSFGLVLNRLTNVRMNDVFPALTNHDIPLLYGGPVETESLHMLHTFTEWAEGGIEVCRDVYYGGDTVAIIDALINNQLDLSRIRFFAGYSGWGGGQLEVEMDLDSWLTVPANFDIIFNSPPNETWKRAVQLLDEKYHPIIHYPLDPQLN